MLANEVRFLSVSGIQTSIYNQIITLLELGMSHIPSEVGTTLVV